MSSRVTFSSCVGKIQSVSVLTVVLFYCPFMIISRVYLKYHTFEEVIVGGLIGSVITPVLFWSFRDNMI